MEYAIYVDGKLDCVLPLGEMLERKAKDPDIEFCSVKDGKVYGTLREAMFAALDEMMQKRHGTG